MTVTNGRLIKENDDQSGRKQQQQPVDVKNDYEDQLPRNDSSYVETTAGQSSRWSWWTLSSKLLKLRLPLFKLLVQKPYKFALFDSVWNTQVEKS